MDKLRLLDLQSLSVIDSTTKLQVEDLLGLAPTRMSKKRKATLYMVHERKFNGAYIKESSKFSLYNLFLKQLTFRLVTSSKLLIFVYILHKLSQESSLENSIVMYHITSPLLSRKEPRLWIS
ncbi:hypothetical protein MTR_7g446080 [Medicago truncatula]|uniref:Uncharacterized protein n=1 Tax=Medicago truncatula TaxID=3880 RepID=A0A072TYA5_MEDTR|nr:hypothetical protein MTR_7g446080 [Medicago truncatula]